MFFSKKKRELDIDRAEIDLTTGSFGDRRGAPTEGSDRLIPKPFPEVIPAPDFDAVEAELCAYIAEAAASGALDEGSARYADQWITKKLAGWLERLETEFQLRTDTATWIVSGRAANLTVGHGHLVALEDELVGKRAELARLADVLRGEPSATEPAHTTTPGTLPELPSATHLTGLGLREESVITVPTEWSATPADHNN